MDEADADEAVMNVVLLDGSWYTWKGLVGGSGKGLGGRSLTEPIKTRCILISCSSPGGGTLCTGVINKLPQGVYTVGDCVFLSLKVKYATLLKRKLEDGHLYRPFLLIMHLSVREPWMSLPPPAW